MMTYKDIPRINGTLRAKSIQMPEVIWSAKGMVVLGRRIKSCIFTTDIAIIRNCNADAVLAVYPFTPQQIINTTIINTASIPVFCGVGGGTTQGVRTALIAKDAEADGAYGVVVNSPMKNGNIEMIKRVIDFPVIATVVNENTDIEARLDAGASILNVSAAAKTPELVRHIRAEFPGVPIIATGGPTDDTIRETIAAGANTISYTPPGLDDIFSAMMTEYRKEAARVDSPEEKEMILEEMLELI